MNIRYLYLIGLFPLAGVAHASLSINPTSYYQFATGSTTADSMGTMNLTGAGSLATGTLFGQNVTDATTRFEGPLGSSNSTDPAVNKSVYTEPGTGSFSVSLWYYATANAGSWSFIASQGGTNANPTASAGWALQLNSSGTVSIGAGNQNATNYTRVLNLYSSNQVTLNAWNHIVWILDSTTGNAYLYLNGTRTDATVAPGYNIAVNNANGEFFRQFMIGSASGAGGSGPIAGTKLADVGIWRGAAISGIDVEQIYNVGNGASLASLMAVPEPSTYGLLGAGSLALVTHLSRRRRRI